MERVIQVIWMCMAVVLSGSLVQTQEASGSVFKTIINNGTGAIPLPNQTVVVHYTGKLKSNGQKFDSSRDRNEPFKFKLGAGDVIAGWDAGVGSMRVGERAEIEIPPEYAYGVDGYAPVIPGGSTLIFDIELLAVEGGTQPVLNIPAPAPPANSIPPSSVTFHGSAPGSRTFTVGAATAGTGGAPTQTEVVTLGDLFSGSGFIGNPQGASTRNPTFTPPAVPSQQNTLQLGPKIPPSTSTQPRQATNINAGRTLGANGFSNPQQAAASQTGGSFPSLNMLTGQQRSFTPPAGTAPGFNSPVGMSSPGFPQAPTATFPQAPTATFPQAPGMTGRPAAGVSDFGRQLGVDIGGAGAMGMPGMGMAGMPSGMMPGAMGMGAMPGAMGMGAMPTGAMGMPGAMGMGGAMPTGAMGMPGAMPTGGMGAAGGMPGASPAGFGGMAAGMGGRFGAGMDPSRPARPDMRLVETMGDIRSRRFIAPGMSPMGPRFGAGRIPPGMMGPVGPRMPGMPGMGPFGPRMSPFMGSRIPPFMMRRAPMRRRIGLFR